jgi:hypothetical protein
MTKTNFHKTLDEPIGVPELEDFQDFYEEKETTVDRVMFKLFAKNPNAMKIVRLLHDTQGDYYTAEITKACGLTTQNCVTWLKKLTQAGIIERYIPTPVSMKKVFYRIPNKEVATKLIKRYFWICSFQLANAIPFNQMSIEELKKNKQLYDLCQKYSLTFEEAIEALELNKIRVEAVYSERERGKLVGFRRIPMPVESWAIPEEEKKSKEAEEVDF